MRIFALLDESVDDFNRLFYEALCNRDLLLEIFVAHRDHFFQRQKPDLDSRQRLNDFILQPDAEISPFIFLSCQNILAQGMQVVLQISRFLEKLGGLFASPLKRPRRNFMAGNFLLQLVIRVDEL